MRFRTFFGVILLTLVLSGCQGMGIKTDVLNSDSILVQDQQDAPLVFHRGPEVDPHWVFGAITTETTLSELLEAIPEKQKYETVVVLAPTTHKTETHELFTYEDPGILEGVAFDRATIRKLKEANLVASLGAVKNGSFWSRPFTRVLRHHFPEAQFLFLSLHEDLPRPDITGAALRSHLPEESIVLALTEFEAGATPNIDQFQQNFTDEVFRHFDETRWKDLPAKQTVTLEVLGRYLRLRGATRTDLKQNHQTLFYKGEPFEEPSTVYLVAFGDIMLGRFVRTLMDGNGLDYPFTLMDNNYLRVNDLLLANLEGPITGSAVRTSTGMSFGFFPDTAPLLKKYHFDLLSQANNHTLDKRHAGYEESMELIRTQGITPFGHQHEINNQSVAYTHIRGQKFAFLGLEEVNSPIDDEAALQKVKDLVAEGYKVIVYPHWGTEYVNRPGARERGLAHAWIDAGAYAVIGHHPHVIQTYETYKGRPIFYSLGNAIFDQYWSVPTQEGLSIALAMSDEQTIIYFFPIKIDRSRMRLMTSDEARVQLEKLVEWGDHTEEERQAILNGKLVL